MRLAEAEAWLEGLINLERMPDLRRALRRPRGVATTVHDAGVSLLSSHG